MDEQLAQLARLLVTTRLVDACDIRRVDDDGRLVRAAVAAVDPATEALIASLDEETYAARQAVETRRSVLQRAVPEGADTGPRTRAGAGRPQAQLSVSSGAAVPLTVRGRVLAVLGLGRRPDAPGFNEDDLQLAEEIAVRAALALDNAVLLADERASAERLSLLQRATAALSAATTPAQVGTTAAAHIRSCSARAPPSACTRWTRPGACSPH